LRWYEHVLRKDDNDWVKQCFTLEAEGDKEVGPGKCGKRLWTRIWMICTWNWVMLWIRVNGGKLLQWIRVTEAVTMMLRAECELYIFGASSPRLTWI